jgi:hypothetical protein
MSLGYRTIALTVATSGCMAWAVALWPFGVWASVAGGVCGAVAGVLGARPLARLEERAHVEGGLRRWLACGAVLVALWLALVIVPSVVAGLVRDRLRPKPEPVPPLNSAPLARLVTGTLGDRSNG